MTTEPATVNEVNEVSEVQAWRQHIYRKTRKKYVLRCKRCGNVKRPGRAVGSDPYPCKRRD